MMTEPQPEYVWAFSDEKPKRGRVWLTVSLSVAAVAIAAAAFLLFVRPSLSDAAKAPAPTPSASVSAPQSATPSVTTSPTSTPSPSPVPSTEPTAPIPAEPDLTAFRDRVRPWLSDAMTGLGFLSDSDAAEAQSIIESLQGDEQRLADQPVPPSIRAEWRETLAAYSDKLDTLSSAVANGTDRASALKAARQSVEALQATAGL